MSEIFLAVAVFGWTTAIVAFIYGTNRDGVSVLYGLVLAGLGMTLGAVSLHAIWKENERYGCRNFSVDSLTSLPEINGTTTSLITDIGKD